MVSTSRTAKSDPLGREHGRVGKAHVAVILCVFLVAALVPEATGQGQPKPLSKDRVVQLLKGDVSPARVAELARQRGIDFETTQDTEKELRNVGATDALITTLRGFAPKPDVPKKEPALPALPIESTPEGEIRNGALAKAEAEAKAGRLRDAVLGAQDILKHDPNNLRAHKLLGRIYLRSIGDVQTATVPQDVLNLVIEQYEQIVKLEPSNVDEHMVLGRLYRINKNVARAESEFKAALRLSPGLEEAATALDVLYNEELHRPTGTSNRATAAPESPSNFPSMPDDAKSTIEATMKFIEDKMNDQGTMHVVIRSSTSNWQPSASDSLMYDVLADVTTCTLHVKKKIFAPDGAWEHVVMSTGPFKDVDSIVVESAEHRANREGGMNGHPEVSVSYTPPEYLLSLTSKHKDGFAFHEVYRSGNEPPNITDGTRQQNVFGFHDEETANRVANAMRHAVELCSGGNK
jgi:tetratricopeptide (TPR) repeat protein